MSFCVLVVDDNKEQRENLVQLLEIILPKWGFDGVKIQEADSSQKALELFENGGIFDFVLSDVQCDLEDPKRKSGFEVIRQAKKRNPKCLAILMSGGFFLGNEVLEECGADNAFQKPFLASSLKEPLEKHFSLE